MTNVQFLTKIMELGVEMDKATTISEEMFPVHDALALYDEHFKELRETLKYVRDTIENMDADAWWIDCPNKGGFDMEKINNVI